MLIHSEKQVRFGIKMSLCDRFRYLFNVNVYLETERNLNSTDVTHTSVYRRLNETETKFLWTSTSHLDLQRCLNTPYKAAMDTYHIYCNA